MKYIEFGLEIHDTYPVLVVFGQQEVLYDKYIAEPTRENRELFLSSLEDEIALNIDFTITDFQETKTHGK